MLSQVERIGTDHFKDIMKNGVTIRSQVMYLKMLPQNDVRRFAVVVPKKTVKGAVQRHLFKRRIMAAIRSVKEQFPTGDYIVFATEQILGSRGPVLEQVISDLAAKVASTE